MAIQGLNPTACCSNSPTCPDKFGCPPNQCPDFEIRRHDTMPPYRVSVSDCNGPLNLDGCIAEVSMWAKAKLKKALLPTDTYFCLADDIGFQQLDVGDVVVMDRIRNPEQMLVTGFDEDARILQVQRGYNGTTPGSYRRGCQMRIFRILNAVAETHTITETIPNVDGTFEDIVADARLVYNWVARDTCLPGCFWLEFKLLKMVESSSLSLWPDVVPVPIETIPYITAMTGMGMAPMSDQFCSTCGILPTAPSFVPSFVNSVSGCDLGAGVEWVRRFPLEGDGFLIKIFDSPTSESVL